MAALPPHCPSNSRASTICRDRWFGFLFEDNMKRKANSIRVILISLSIVAGANVARAQSASPSPAPTASPKAVETPTASPTPAPPPRVTGTGGHLELDDIIQVQVDHFSEWAATNDATKLVPFINGRAIRGNYPEEIHPDKNRLHFHLEITPANKEVWTDLLGAPTGTHHPVTFTIGLENQSPLAAPRWLSGSS